MRCNPGVLQNMTSRGSHISSCTKGKFKLRKRVKVEKHYQSSFLLIFPSNNLFVYCSYFTCTFIFYCSRKGGKTGMRLMYFCNQNYCMYKKAPYSFNISLVCCRPHATEGSKLGFTKWCRQPKSIS